MKWEGRKVSGATASGSGSRPRVCRASLSRMPATVRRSADLTLNDNGIRRTLC